MPLWAERLLLIPVLASHPQLSSAGIEMLCYDVIPAQIQMNFSCGRKGMENPHAFISGWKKGEKFFLFSDLRMEKLLR